MSDEYGIIDLIVSVYKDSVEKEEIEKLQREYMQVLRTEAEARRKKSDALIRQMSELRMAIKKFEFTYQRLLKRCGTSIPEVDKYIADVNLKIKRASYEKNNLIRK